MIEQESLVLDLVLKWEQAAASGQPVDIEELCRDHLELLPHVRAHVAALKSIRPILDTNISRDTSADGTKVEDGSATRAVGESHYEGEKVHARGGLGEVLVAQ